MGVEVTAFLLESKNTTIVEELKNLGDWRKGNLGDDPW